MGVEVLLELAADMCPDRLAVGSRAQGMTFSGLAAAAGGGAKILAETGARSVGFLGVNGPSFTVAVFASAIAGIPICPLNYRLPDADLLALIDRLDTPVLLVDGSMRERIIGCERILDTEEWLAASQTAQPLESGSTEDDEVAVVLFTSGTTAAPKAVLLRHENLTSYVLQTVEMLGADEDDCALVAVPPYHVAGVATVLSNAYAGRRVLHLPQFTAKEWVDVVSAEKVTSAMVVPTMLARVVEILEETGESLPGLRGLAYGGSRVPPTVLERALRALPTVGFTNAYGLTETSSTITVLGPEDHRAALSGDDDARRRLSSAGHAVPGMELQIRSETGDVLPSGSSGLLFVRGAQVSGTYEGLGSALDAQGWFPTKDRAHLDAEGYLFLEGRDDDIIIRGGENVAPAEVEDVLMEHGAVTDAAVVGLPDEEWGQRIVAVVTVLAQHADSPELVEELKTFARSRLRGARSPDSIHVWAELPYNPAGKLMRRDIIATLTLR